MGPRICSTCSMSSAHGPVPTEYQLPPSVLDGGWVSDACGRRPWTSPSRDECQCASGTTERASPTIVARLHIIGPVRICHTQALHLVFQCLPRESFHARANRGYGMASFPVTVFFLWQFMPRVFPGRKYFSLPWGAFARAFVLSVNVELSFEML